MYNNIQVDKMSESQLISLYRRNKEKIKRIEEQQKKAAPVHIKVLIEKMEAMVLGYEILTLLMGKKKTSLPDV